MEMKRYEKITPPIIVSSHHPPVYPKPVETGVDFLQGTSVSQGVTQGPARILSHPSEASELEPGFILVAKSIDPGWTPIFPLCKGLVLEAGGLLSHGIVVARELGLPAIVGISRVTEIIQNGSTIMIDANLGKVYLKI
jgi:rifampicin phosphotransferase